MTTIKALQLFQSNKYYLNIFNINSNYISIDFVNVETFNNKDLNKLFKILKIATINDIKIKLLNVCSDISKFFRSIGLYKVFDIDNPFNVKKRIFC